MRAEVIHGDCLSVMRTMPAASVSPLLSAWLAVQERRAHGRVALDLLDGVTRATERRQVGGRVALGVPVRNDVVYLHSVRTTASGASVAVSFEDLVPNDSPCAIVRSGPATSPEDATTPGLTIGLPARIACGSADHTALPADRLSADDARSTVLPLLAPSARDVADRGAVARRRHTAPRHIERPPAVTARLRLAVLRPVRGKSCRTLSPSHVTIVSRREAEYVEIARRRIANVAPLFAEPL